MSTPIVRYRKRPVEVDTIQWTGSNEAEVQAFTGRANFYALDDEDRAGCDDPEATATVFDKLHSTWVLVYTGQHIVRGVKGELYPIAEDVLAETYKCVEEATAETATATLDFFQKGHVYARQHHGRTIEFHVIHVATAPDCDFPTAFGWRKDPEIDVMLPMDADDFHGCGWVDVTEAGDGRG